jgi:hypothetical protein
MFIPGKDSQDGDNLVNPYRIISAVWHIRVGPSSPQSRVFLNPNAAIRLSPADAEVLARTLPREQPRK